MEEVNGGIRPPEHPHQEDVVTQYLLAIQQPQGETPPPADLEAIMTDVEAVRRDMIGAGVWVFSGGLHDAIDLAEEAVADAFAVAVERWPAEGTPSQPGGWIVTTARMNRAVELSHHHLWHAVRADLLARLGRHDEASAALDAAYAATGNVAEQRLLQERREALDTPRSTPST